MIIASVQLGLRELCESREVLRFALCFSFQPQLVPGFIISKGDKAPNGRKLAGAQAAGPSALGASQQTVPWKQGSCPRGGGGLGGASLPQHWTLEEPLCDMLKLLLLLSRFSRVRLCDPIGGSPPGFPSLGFSRQEHWSGLPFPSPMHESEK